MQAKLLEGLKKNSPPSPAPASTPQPGSAKDSASVCVASDAPEASAAGTSGTPTTGPTACADGLPRVTFAEGAFYPALKVATTFASTDETRPHLNSVRLMWGPDTAPGSLGYFAEIVAMDGHTLMRYRWPLTELLTGSVRGEDKGHGRAPGVLMMPLEHALEVLKLPGMKKGCVTLDAAGLVTCEGTSKQTKPRGKDVHFLPYEQILPNGFRALAVEGISLSAVYIARAASAFSAFRPKESFGVTMRQHAGDELSPMYFTSKNVPGLEAVIMPMRM